MDLARVDWSAAAVELGDEYRRTGTFAARRAFAAVASLRGRFEGELSIAVASARAAIELEPLDPIHRVREALVYFRFGDLAAVRARLDALGELGELPHVLVIEAMALARSGEPRTARNVADRALQTDPKHAAARFLYTEANLAASAKGGLDKLGELPRGAQFDAAWADLLVKLAILRPGDGKPVAQQLERGAISKGSRAEAIARTLARWVAAPADELAAAARAQDKDSHAEQVALALLLEKLDDHVAAATTLRGLHAAAPDRPAVRRALVAALTKLAVAEAAQDQFAAAARATQICSDLEPHEPAHLQNRAALFTLMGEHESALDAWAELDRHHYRLALLGRLDPANARRFGAPHRMFSQAARVAGRTGVFVIEEKPKGKSSVIERELAVNQQAIDRDPEQLRHWLHHTRAALVFELVALGSDPVRLLLAPPTPVVAEARAEAMATLARSLAVLVPDEGKALADRLAVRFRAAAAAVPMRYVAAELDAEAIAVHRHAIELYAELALLCLRWEPDPSRRGVFDDVLETVRAIAPLFDEGVLAGAVKDSIDGPPTALAFLEQVTRVILEVHDRETVLDPMQRRRLGNTLVASLRTSLVERRAIESKGDLSRHAVEQLVEQLDLARKDDPSNARLEYWAAQLAVLGDFLDECAEAIAAFHRAAKGDHPLAERIERVQEMLDEKRKNHRESRTRAGHAPAVNHEDAGDIAAREAALEAQPTSMQRYTELCYDLALVDRWREAHAWSDRALARCLTPAGQLRARELKLELQGLQVLAQRDPPSVASYLGGARASALPALEKLEPGNFALEYVRGLCLLAADRRADAQRAFAVALEACTRGIYLAVLRPLATDVEAAVREAAKKDIDGALADGRFRDAFARIAERIATSTRPEAYVLELARTQLAAILPTVGTAETPIAPPPVVVDAAWRGELSRAIQIAAADARTRALIDLAKRVDEPSLRDADALLRRLDDLDDQLALAAALDQSTKLAAAGDHAGALARLADLGPAGERNARVLRQRAIVQLRLHAFAEADQAVSRLAELPDPVAREFAGRYPGLRFRQRIAVASAAIRAREFAKAREHLASALPAAPEQELEHAYCRAYCAADEGYRALATGDRSAARPLLFEALALVEARRSDATTYGHDRLLELHRKLEQDIDKVDHV
ncbi:MAG: hypothetical protein ABI867_08170 [Kofleriaceae bacterium]